MTDTPGGEMDDDIRGYNTGYDAGRDGKDALPEGGAPDEDPWRSSSVRGYRDGYADGSNEAIDGYDDA